MASPSVDSASPRPFGFEAGDAIRLTASVLHTWVGGTEHWDFELPCNRQPGRMRTGWSGKWRPWHSLTQAQSDHLADLCRETAANPELGDQRPVLFVDGSAMRLRLTVPGALDIEEMIPMNGWLDTADSAQLPSLLRLVAAVRTGEWPDRAPIEGRRPILMGSVASPAKPGGEIGFYEMTPPAWPGRSDTGSVILPLRDGRLRLHPDSLDVDGLPLRAKEEVHLTLLSSGEAEAVAAHLTVSAWEAAFNSLDWRLAPCGSAVLLQEKKATGLEYSIVAPVECPAVNAFRRQLSEASGVLLPDTVPHVTLWVRPGGRGIGISSQAQYQDCRVREWAPADAGRFLEGSAFTTEELT